MKNLIKLLVFILFINFCTAGINDKQNPNKKITIKYSGFNNDFIIFDQESKSILSTNSNSLSKFFNQSKITKIKYEDLNNNIYESSDKINFYLTGKSVNQIKLNDSNIDMRIYPNPTNDEFSINIFLKKESNIKIILSDLSRTKLINLFEERNAKGTIAKNYSAGEFQLERGIYLVTIITDTETKVLKFIKL